MSVCICVLSLMHRGFGQHWGQDYSQICIITQIPYCLFESYVNHVTTINIPSKMAASSLISVKLCLWTACGCKYIANKSYRSKTN